MMYNLVGEETDFQIIHSRNVEFRCYIIHPIHAAAMFNHIICEAWRENRPTRDIT